MVGALRILRQRPEVIDHLRQRHLPGALGPNSSLIGVDLVRYRHMAILQMRSVILDRFPGPKAEALGRRAADQRGVAAGFGMKPSSSIWAGDRDTPLIL